MVSDMVLVASLPEKVLKSAEMYAGCISGALKKEEYLNKIKIAGFKEIKVIKEDPVRLSDYIGADKVISDIARDMTDSDIENIDKVVVSIKIAAKKEA